VTVNIELFDSLDEVARDAAGALDRAHRTSLYDRLDWFRLIAAYCPPDGKLLAIRSESGGRRGWLIFARDGRTVRPYSSWYSLRTGPIGDQGDDVMTSFGTALRDEGVATIELAPLEHPEPLAAGLRAAGWIVEVAPDKANWRIVTEGMDFDAYWATRPGKLRSTAKRKAKAAGLDVTVHTGFSPEAWADYEAVYRESWKPEEGSFPFLRALAGQEGAAGALRLGIARKEGMPVAAQLWLVENGEATIHKLAYAESAKPLSPGTILGEAMFRHVLDRDRVSMIDYGLGDEPYKADWMGERRTLWRLTAHDPRRLAGLAGVLRAKASNLARRLRSR
jgi:CelD/BcsL family acetyltransferase involved in cellulose biosynthesis